MGVFSKVLRYREAGEDANVHNVANFGEPVRSLFTSSKVFTIHHHIDITDEHEELVYEANSKAVSIRDKTDVTDAVGRQVAHIERKVFTIHETHMITMADGTDFILSNELFHLIKDITNIEGLGWQLRGNILGLNFELYDKDGSIIAVIGQKMRQMVESKTNGTVEFESQVNPDIIGGFILEYDTYRMDASVKTKLNSILTKLKK